MYIILRVSTITLNVPENTVMCLRQEIKEKPIKVIVDFIL